MVLEQGGQALRSDIFLLFWRKCLGTLHTTGLLKSELMCCPLEIVYSLFFILQNVSGLLQHTFFLELIKKKKKQLMYRTQAVFQKRFLERVTQHLMLPYHDLELSLIALSCLGNRDFHSGQSNVQGKISFLLQTMSKVGGPLTISAISVQCI